MSAKPLTNRTTLKNDSAAVTVLPVARGRAFTRGLVWTVPAVLIAGTIFLVARPLNFAPTGTSNRIVDYSIALALIPFAIVGIAMAIKATSSLALAFWPVRLGVFLTEHGVRMRLGPLGVKSFDAARINVRYPFELIDEDDNGGVEAFSAANGPSKLAPAVGPDHARLRERHGGRRRKTAPTDHRGLAPTTRGYEPDRCIAVCSRLTTCRCAPGC